MVINRTIDLFRIAHPIGAIAHGVNTQGVMGAGFARTLAEHYPGVLDPYRQACRSRQLVPGGVFQWQTYGITIFNLATQEYYGRAGRARIEWIESAMIELRKLMENSDARTCVMPRIGAGLGGLKWSDVSAVINTVFGECAPTVIVCHL